MTRKYPEVRSAAPARSSDLIFLVRTRGVPWRSVVIADRYGFVAIHTRYTVRVINPKYSLAGADPGSRERIDGRNPELAENGYRGSGMASPRLTDKEGGGEVVSIGNGLPSDRVSDSRARNAHPWRNLTYSAFGSSRVLARTSPHACSRSLLRCSRRDSQFGQRSVRRTVTGRY